MPTAAATLQAPESFLAGMAVENLHRFFHEQTTHRPAPEMYRALYDIINTLDAMARGEAERKVYLSSLDPGVGKTSAICAFVDALLTGPEYQDVGVIICLSRLDEIRGLVHRMGIPPEMFAVLTSDKALNALGVGEGNTDQAQVLFTTQQRIERHLEGRSFEACAEFHYRGRPRAVRIWDESWLPGQTLTISRDDIGLLFKPMRPVYPELTDAIEDLFTSIRSMDDGSRVQVPDFEQTYGVGLNEVLALFDLPYNNDDASLKDDQRLVASSLWFMSGRTVSVRRDGAYGNTALSYRETLPEDLAPLLVLDASGRVRETYTQMERSRDNLIRLGTAAKSYRSLKVHVWRTGGGKSSFGFNDKGQELIDGILGTIRTKPEEQWLVVVHKPSRRVRDVERAVRDLLGNDVDQGKVHFINWGRHTATNAYAQVPNVILAGTLFYRPSYYEALGRLAAKTPAHQRYPLEAQQRIALGEHQHGILQALCRGSVRQCIGGECAPCDAYVIASVQTGIPDTLAKMFPGCQLLDWKPIRRALRGKVGQAVGYLRDRFSDPMVELVKFKEVMKAIGMNYSQSFRDDIRRHPEFKAEVAELGLVEWGKGKYFTAFRRVRAKDYGFDEQD